MTNNLTGKNDAVSLNEGLLVINQAALKFVKVSEYDELFKIIVETLRELAHVKSVVLAMYDAQKKVSRVKYFEIDSFLLNEIMTLFGGKKITEIELPISDETFEIIRNSPVSMLPTLNEAAFGSISKITGKVIQAVQGIDRYVGLAYFVDDELFGTTLLGLEKTSVDPSKEILYSFSQLVSLTLKRLRTTEELKESELQYRNLANAGPSLIWTSGTDKLCNYFNDTWLKFTGRSLEQEMGNGWAEGVHPDDFDRCLETYVTAFDKREPFEMEYRLRHSSGEYRLILDIGTPNFDRLEEFIGYIGHCFDITERKHIEEILKKSEEKYRIIAESMTDVVWTCDLERKLTFISSSIERLTGETVEENMKKSFESRFVPESLARIMPMFAQEFEKEKDPSVPKNRARIIEAQQYKKDESTIWVEMSVSFIRGKNGNPTGFQGITRDITDRKKAEEKLEKSDRIFNHSIDMLCIAGFDGYFKTLSPSWEKVLGWSTQELLSKPWIKFTHPDDVEKTKSVKAVLLDNGDKVYHFENRYICKDGSVKWLSWNSFPYPAEGIMFGVARDITEQKKTEEILRKSEEKYRLIAENMGNVVTMLDMELNYIYGTPNVESVFGFKLDEYLKLRVDQTMSPESLKIVMKTFEEEMVNELSGVSDPKRNRVLELEEYRKDGSTIWMENVLSYVRDETGKPVGILSVSRDVTERKRALEEKTKLTEQLYHAQKMESVGTLAGGIAHDFNNLLQVIGGYTSMLLSVEGRNISEVDRLKIIEKAVDRASELVSNLLTFSRKNVSMKKNVDLNSEIAVAVNILERTIPKMIKIKTEFDPSIPKISADPIQIEQILLNLGKNSSDAMPDGGTILIKTEDIKNSGGSECKCGKILKGKYIAMTFSDTGSGMDKETKDHVFDPFFTTKEVGKGTGLGLASVYGIVESHGGHIHCESELGKGTVFTIYFPADVTGNDNEKVITQKTKKLEGSERVLIVDDEKNIRELYSSALGEFGYKVLTAGSGEEALIIFKENHHEIDILILDLGMPGMGGFKCMLEMKKIFPDSKIIIASGYSEVFQTEDLLKSGASGFIQKPFKLKNVLEKIREVLDENIQSEHK